MAARVPGGPDRDMAPLKLQILGGFRLLGTDGQTRRLPTRKAEALLAYLAIPPQRAHRRDHLAGLLWGDRGDRQARHSLNQTVFSIRKVVAEPGVDPIELYYFEVGGEASLEFSYKNSTGAFRFGP